jgi:hypothetical protein
MVRLKRSRIQAIVVTDPDYSAIRGSKLINALGGVGLPGGRDRAS